MGDFNIDTQTDVLLVRRKLDLLLRTGKLLMESAADTNRIERNMLRVASFLEIPEDKLHLDIRWKILIVNVSDDTYSFSKFQKCEHHGINMSTLLDISNLSFRAIKQKYTLDEYERELEIIANKPRNFNNYLVALGAGLACGGFCKLFGCDWIAFLFTAIAAFVGFRLRTILHDKDFNVYMSVTCAAFVATCLAYLSSFTGLSLTPYHPLLACVVFLVPGVPMINAVDDLIDSHLLVGFTRATNSLMMIGSMTFGITMALSIFILNDTDIVSKFRSLSIIPQDPYYVYALAAAVAAMGFSMIFNLKPKLLWLVALGGMTSVCIRNFINFELGYGPVIGSFFGGFVVSLLAIIFVRKYNIPNHVVSIPSVIPMVPGVLMYRSLLSFFNMNSGENEVANAFSNGVTAALIMLCIAIGVAIPNIFARRFLAGRKLKFVNHK
ncbi:MAG: threonine/serine exporter family protein [Rikenellaceae bacterium]